jgi:hypothetical protein
LVKARKRSKTGKVLFLQSEKALKRKSRFHHDTRAGRSSRLAAQGKTAAAHGKFNHNWRMCKKQQNGGSQAGASGLASRETCHARIKDGKEHRYWSVVENRRCGRGKVVQRQVLYLGEINEIATDNSEGARAEVVVDEGLTYRRDQVTIAVDRYSPGVGDLIACL